MVPTTRLMRLARSSIIASFALKDPVLRASSFMVASMPVRSTRPSSARTPVCEAMRLTSVIVRANSWLVVEISFTAAAASFDEEPNSVTTCCCPALVACMDDAVASSVEEDCWMLPISPRKSLLIR